MGCLSASVGGYYRKGNVVHEGSSGKACWAFCKCATPGGPAESRDHPRDLAVKEMQAEPLVPLQWK